MATFFPTTAVDGRAAKTDLENVRHSRMSAECYSIPRYHGLASGVRPRHIDAGHGRLGFPKLKLFKTNKATGEPDTTRNMDWRLIRDTSRRPVLLPVRDQGSCGACFAFSVTGVLAHRLSIQSNGKYREPLSVEELVVNGANFVNTVLLGADSAKTFGAERSHGLARAITYNLDGCAGGLLASAYDYLIVKGVPTEKRSPYDAYNLTEDDSVVVNPNADRHRPSVSSSGGKGSTDATRVYAMNAHSLVKDPESGFSSDTVNLSQSTLSYNCANMMAAVSTQGPISTGINVFSDLLDYPTALHLANEGIYEPADSVVDAMGDSTPTEFRGGHAVIVVGHGTSAKGKPFWIVENSWSSTWGFKGYFYIIRGKNACNIELDAMAADPDMDRSTLGPTSAKNTLGFSLFSARGPTHGPNHAPFPNPTPNPNRTPNRNPNRNPFPNPFTKPLDNRTGYYDPSDIEGPWKGLPPDHIDRLRSLARYDPSGPETCWPSPRGAPLLHPWVEEAYPSIDTSTPASPRSAIPYRAAIAIFGVVLVVLTTLVVSTKLRKSKTRHEHH